jgi:hypothetical protein
VERPYVGIDLHRRRSVIYTMTSEGEKVSCVRIANDPVTLLETVRRAKLMPKMRPMPSPAWCELLGRKDRLQLRLPAGRIR